MPFKKLELIEPILKALVEEGYTTPTPIQLQTYMTLAHQVEQAAGCGS